MRRPPDYFVVLLTLFLAAMAIAVVAGLRSAPHYGSTDPRRSTHLSGPHGASGFAETMERLGVSIEYWRQPLFRLDSERSPDRDSWLVLLEPSMPLDEFEVDAVMRWAEAGGNVFSAGATGIEPWFSLRIYRPPRSTRSDRDALVPKVDTDLALTEAGALFRPLRPPRLLPFLNPPGPERRVGFEVAGTQVLLQTVRGDTLALRYDLDSGARMVLLADSRYLSNEEMKNTDAGLVALPLLLNNAPAYLVIDEFHHRFGKRISLSGAAWSWMRRSPLGWAILQLAAAGLLLLAMLAVRFGPALHRVEYRRRSSLEHVEALAAGLERARGRQVAVDLMVEGLRRRLGRSGGTEPATSERLRRWLDSLEVALPAGTGHPALQRLAYAVEHPNERDQIIGAANAVEELWEAMQPRTISN